ncbi:hypothetical protein ACM55F_09440 [Flavobacterium sp. XS2P12]|uniref:hypothetical protein n=1 Tax=Flavobacterium melibiosi TaxID=3398734 RepID=UPI003A880574
MDDFYKLFGGYGNYKKLMSHSGNMNSITALSSQLHIASWAQKSNEDLMLKAITGNSLQLWETLNKPPKTPGYVGMPITMAISHYINNFPKANLAFNLSSLASPMVTLQQQWMEKNNQNSSILNAVMGNTASMLAAFNNRPKIPDSIISVFGTNWYNYANQSNIVDSTINALGVSQNNEVFKSSEFIHEKAILNKSKDRFVANVSKIMTEIGEVEDEDLINIQAQFDEALKQEIAVAVATPISLYTFEFIINNYNEIIENFIKVGEISNDVIKSLLQTTDFNSANFSAMNWFFVNIFIGCVGAFVYDKIKSPNEKHSLTKISINAITKNSKTILSKPHGNGKVICDIPESTFIIIGASKGKYIEVRVQLNGATYLGWTINEDISER